MSVTGARRRSGPHGAAQGDLSGGMFGAFSVSGARRALADGDDRSTVARGSTAVSLRARPQCARTHGPRTDGPSVQRICVPGYEQRLASRSETVDTGRPRPLERGWQGAGDGERAEHAARRVAHGQPHADRIAARRAR